jgi:hypothetical protein
VVVVGAAIRLRGVESASYRWSEASLEQAETEEDEGEGGRRKAWKYWPGGRER